MVFGDEKVELFRNGSGAHISLQHLLRMRDPEAGLLFRLREDARFGRGVVEQASRRLD